MQQFAKHRVLGQVGSRGRRKRATSLCLTVISWALLHAGALAQVLGPGDRIKVSVFQSPELSAEARVLADGRVALPGLGGVDLAGLTESAAQERIAQMLVDQGLLLRPQVSVEALQWRSREFSVLGHVARPGRYGLETAGLRVSEALALAGGTSAGAADRVTLKTRREGRWQWVTIDLPALFESRDAVGGEGRSDDPLLEPGDQLWVGPAPQVYVQGAVAQPGAQNLTRGLTLRQAVARSGGFVQPAEGSRRTEPELQLTRQSADGQTLQVTPHPSERLQAGDVVSARLR